MNLQKSFFALLLCCLVLIGPKSATAMPSPLEVTPGSALSDTISGPTRLAQTQPAPNPAPTPSPSPAPAADEPIGNVATLTGSATVTRNNAAMSLKLQDDILLNDVLQTSANSRLGITFNDATTFNLTANAQITVDFYLYEDGGQKNGALFDIAKGTVAFVAAAVAKTGDMRISTPTATLGIRGTTGLVEVPEGASAASANHVAVKLYPDPDGRVGRIEVNGRDGSSLGFLTQGASGFTIRPGAGGRFAALPLRISPQQVLRDQGIVRQVHAAQTLGRQIVTQRRIQRQQNPNNPARTSPANRPANNPGNNPANPARQPGLQRQNGLPQRPGTPGQPNRAGPPGQPTPAPSLPRQPNAPGLRQGEPQRPNGAPPKPASPQPPALPNRAGQQGQPAPGVQRPNAPALRQGGLPNRPVLQRRPPAGPKGKRKPEPERR